MEIIVIMLLAGFFIGRSQEAKHIKSLQEREASTSEVVTINFAPKHWKYAPHCTESELVCGNVVISIDYFKRVASGFKSLVGGSLTAIEPLLVRARREAILRMKAEAINGGFNHVINVRIETSRLASARANGKGIAGIEVLAFGTAINEPK